MPEDHLLVVVAFVLACWFPECFESVPYLWIIGPLGSAKTKLLRVLSSLCPRARIVADIRAAALYQLVDENDSPTLLIDELDINLTRSNSEVLRLLRTGTTRGMPTVRNGRICSTYCFKAIASRHLPTDGALASRCIPLSMLPCEHELPPLDEHAMHQLSDQFQPRLAEFHDEMKTAIEDFQRQPWSLPGMTPRMRQIARVLASPFAGDPEQQALVVAYLADCDESARVARSLEPEWLVAEILFKISHPLLDQFLPSKLTVGAITGEVNHVLAIRGEGEKLKARKVGSMLGSLRLKTKRLGNLGRGIEFTPSVQRQIHEIARHLGIDRTFITNDSAVDLGNGGFRCELCEEAGVTGELRFGTYEELFPNRSRRRQPLFERPLETGPECDAEPSPSFPRDQV